MPHQSPLSPHLQVYRWQLTMVLSIAHRMSGVFLAIGLPLLVYWLAALAAGPGPYATAQALLGSLLGKVVLFGFTFALFYHLCNGVRHLMWDAGYGFSMETAYASGYAVVIAAVVLTLLAWLVVLSVAGGGS